MKSATNYRKLVVILYYNDGNSYVLPQQRIFRNCGPKYCIDFGKSCDKIRYLRIKYWNDSTVEIVDLLVVTTATKASSNTPFANKRGGY